MLNKLKILLLISILSCSHQPKNLKVLTDDDAVTDAMGKPQYSDDIPPKELNDTVTSADDDDDEATSDEIVKPVEIVPEDPEESSSLSSDEKEIIKASFVKEGYDPKLINFWIHYFTQRKPEIFQQHLNNGNDYRELVLSILKEHEVPEELFYLGLIESGYNMKIRSRANAVGPWQFIKGTGKRYKLVTNHHIDERRNIYKSTVAAVKYLKALYAMLGKWELAVAAYNCGENRVIRAMKKGNTDNIHALTEMKLIPKETRYYIPKILAAQIIDKNIEKYGFTRNEPNPKANVEINSFDISQIVDLNKLSQLAKVSKETLLFYNPDIKGNYIPGYKNRPFTIYLPNREHDLISKANINMCKTQLPVYRVAKVVKRDKTKRQVASNSSQKVYRVKKGDSLHKIASKFKVDLKKLMTVNNLKSSTVFKRQSLVIPN